MPQLILYIYIKPYPGTQTINPDQTRSLNLNSITPQSKLDISNLLSTFTVDEQTYIWDVLANARMN